MASRISQQAVDNAKMLSLIRIMAEVIVDMVDHAANLNDWKASYHLVRKYPLKYTNFATGSLAEKHVYFARHYTKIMDALYAAMEFLEGESLKHAVEVEDR